jgi:deoxyribodipyrimidine photo-lyase
MGEKHQPVIRGGRKAAEAALALVDPAAYARSRNYLDGAVARLSPYLRHGVLTLAEVRDHALAAVNRPEEAEKFINELGWRDYWQRLYAAWGNGVWDDRESYKTGHSATAYATQLPQDVASASTGLQCMDSFSRELEQTGYLHNHSRMWLAAYLVHWRHVRWQAGARWFLQHLLDGDPASNNLSWQWVASTFSNKPYFFNRENLERYTGSQYCRQCPARNVCPFDAAYEELEIKLFRPEVKSEAHMPPKPSALPPLSRKADLSQLRHPLVWIHTDSLNPKQELLSRYPQAPAVFVWDEAWLREEQISSKRITFLEECLAEMPTHLEQRRGDLATELLAAATKGNADHVVALRTPDPRLLAAAARVERSLPMVWTSPPRFVDEHRGYDLKRFSRYWRQAQPSAMTPA